MYVASTSLVLEQILSEVWQKMGAPRQWWNWSLFEEPWVALRSRRQAQGWRRDGTLCRYVDRQKSQLRPRTKNLLYRNLHVERVKQQQEGGDRQQDRWGYQGWRNLNEASLVRIFHEGLLDVQDDESGPRRK